MHRKGQSVEEKFSSEELLFRRYRKEHWANGAFSGVGFPFPKHSVNRALFSEPEDVVFSESGDFNGWGVLEFLVSDVPSQIELPPAVFVFFMKHVPHEYNYAHSEIWSSNQVAQRYYYVEPSKAVRKQFRTIMAQAMKIRIEAVI